MRGGVNILMTAYRRFVHSNCQLRDISRLTYIQIIETVFPSLVKNNRLTYNMIFRCGETPKIEAEDGSSGWWFPMCLFSSLEFG
jgi:hypothetical protein